MSDVTVPTESVTETLRKRLQELKTERSSWELHWRELQEYFLTRRGRWINDSKGKGDKRNQKLVDPTPKFAARTLGAGMHAGSTNPATPWFRLTTSDPELMEVPAVSQWLYAVETRMRAIFSRSNLYSVLPSLYIESGVFGTAPMIMMAHAEKVVHFVPKTVGSYYLATNSDGVVDTMYCEYQMTTKQLVDDYGLDQVSSMVANDYKAGNRQKLYNVLHAIEPNKSRDPAMLDGKNKPFRSVHIELGSNDGKGPLRESGFDDNPLAVFRWETTEITDPYGSSCGMDALGLSKNLQFQTKRKAQVIDKHLDPPMVGDPALKHQPSSLVPGDVTWAGFTPTGSAPKFQPAMTVNPQAINYVREDIVDTREVIEQAMYVDLFLAITRADPRNASVPEIEARREEQILGLGPVLQNHKTGLIERVIDFTFSQMVKVSQPVWEGSLHGPTLPDAFIPEPPPELQGTTPKVEMIGALDQAFRSIAAGKIERFWGFVGLVAKSQADSGQEVTAFDKGDADQSIDEYGQAIGVPPSVVRGDEQVAQLRDARAKQREAQDAAAAAQPIKDASIAAKNLSETQMGTGSALDAVAGAA